MLILRSPENWAGVNVIQIKQGRNEFFVYSNSACLKGWRVRGNRIGCGCRKKKNLIVANAAIFFTLYQHQIKRL